MDEFGGPAGSALAEIALLEQHYAVPTRRSIQRDSHTCRSTAHNSQIPWLTPFENPVQEPGALEVGVHCRVGVSLYSVRSSQSRARFNASAHRLRRCAASSLLFLG